MCNNDQIPLEHLLNVILVKKLGVFNTRHEGTQCMRNPIDVVYTWVNGSDPAYQETKKKYPHISGIMDGDLDKMFNDWETLKYSIRSINMFAPWIRNIYIVTNGQIPSWLRVTEGIKIITHDQIFEDKDVLPNFNADVIELYMHRIPGLSDKFLYLNDDMFIGNYLKKEDLCHGENGQKIYLQVKEPQVCAEGCLYEWLGDGVCQEACLNPLCDNDKEDCLPGKGSVGLKEAYFLFEEDDSSWTRAVNRWNIRFNDFYGFRHRHFAPHQACLYDKYVKAAFYSKFRDQLTHISKIKFRDPFGVDNWFTYNTFLMETSERISKGEYSIPEEEARRYQYQALFNMSNSFAMMADDPEEIAGILKDWAPTDLSVRPVFLCLNDATSNPSNPEELRKVLTDYLDGIFNVKSRFEV